MDDREKAQRAIELQRTARDYRMLDVPGYRDWSERQLAQGESDALIAHLDATSMRLTPDDLAEVTDSDFDEMLSELKATLGDETEL